MKLPRAQVVIRMPKKLLGMYQEIADLSGVKIDKVLLVTVATKIVVEKNREPLP